MRISPLALLFVIACGGATATNLDDPNNGNLKLKTNPDGSATGNGTSCTYAGQSVAVGAKFKADCNDCECTAQGAVCTDKACSSAGCVSKGKTYAPGEKWTEPNAECPLASASCECQAGGQALCAAPTIACAIDAGAAPGVCVDDYGQAHQRGEKWNDGCNDCTCGEGGAIGCTKKACQCPPDGTTINCMPAVPPERQQQCSQPYQRWIAKHCPNVKFVY